jgi:hypothetical protein
MFANILIVNVRHVMSADLAEHYCVRCFRWARLCQLMCADCWEAFYNRTNGR